MAPRPPAPPFDDFRSPLMSPLLLGAGPMHAIPDPMAREPRIPDGSGRNCRLSGAFARRCASASAAYPRRSTSHSWKSSPAAIGERCAQPTPVAVGRRRKRFPAPLVCVGEHRQIGPFIDVDVPLVVPLREGDLCVSRQRGCRVRRLLAMGDPRLCRRVRPGHDGAPERVSRLADRAEAGGVVACLPA